MRGLTEEQITVVQLKAHAAETTSTTGSDVAVVDAQEVLAVVDVSAVGADADETMALNIQGTNDAGVTYANAIRDPAEPDDVLATMGTFTQPNGAQVAKVALRPFKEYRNVSTIAGTTPSFTYGVHLMVKSHRMPAAAQLPT